MELKDIRREIDRIDNELVLLLRKRIEMVVRTTQLKEKVEDPAREAQVLENVKRRSIGLLSPDCSEGIFKQLISEAKRQEHLGHELIGFQGEHGAYSEMAALEFSDSVVAVPCAAFSDVFNGIKTGALHLGIVPIENSIGGNVSEVEDLLIESGLYVVGEVNLRVHHCLLALPDTDYRDVRVVYSHPQALSQCRDFLARNKLEARPYYNTAGAAMMLAREKPAASAALASKLCAELYQLEILKENVENTNLNTTHFLVLSKQASSAGGDKCSVLFVTKHQPGALYHFLQAFSDAQINLTRIQSRPAREAGCVAFLLDFQGSDKDTKVQSVLEKIAPSCQTFKVLGCYPGRM